MYVFARWCVSGVYKKAHPPLYLPAKHMTDQQCGLCLSCGAPFLPNIDEVDFFNREGNLSMLFLNTQFKQNPDIQRMYDVPKLCSGRQASHMFHRAYHHTALEYMCERHTDDNPVGPAVPVANAVIVDQANAPFLYYHTATGNKGPMMARWVQPAQNQRIRMKLYQYMNRLAPRNQYFLPPRQMDMMYDMCLGCNALMTQKSHMRFLLGVRHAGEKNVRGRILPIGVFDQHRMEAAGQPLENGYGHWRVQAAFGRRSPLLSKADSDAPAIAYYLHMCLPFQGPGQHAKFQNFQRRAKQARSFYLEMCWIVLEIACLAILLEEGTVTKPRGSKKSHGQHQHLGVLDVYVSFFYWRLMQFTFGKSPRVQELDFVQFHQKYFVEIRNCPGILAEADRTVTTGTLVYQTTNQPGVDLVEQICDRLVQQFQGVLQPFFHFCAGIPRRVTPTIREYFLPVEVVRTLRAKSRQVDLCRLDDFLCRF